MKLVLGRQNPTYSVAAVQLRADITYSKATVSVIIDERGLNKYARDYVNEVDQLTVAFGKGLLTYQDAVDAIVEVSLSKRFADSNSISDSVFISTGFIRAYADAVSNDDAITQLLVLKGLTDTLTTVETRVFDISKAIADSVIVIDNADANSGDGLEYTDIKPSSDLVGAEDLAVAVLEKQLADAVSLAETLQQELAKALDDSVSIAEQALLALARPINDEVVASDAFDRVFLANLAQADSILTSDLLAGIGVEKLLTDAAAAVSSGSLRMTDYVDITYLAEDYVGTSTTFS